ncbi:hypothetical protein RCH09_001684 [Actimicrobium sp. GrIS 1.19]|uniref:hypothetical protein n=1 Tax=Actimicrobium sp. GrIS 1.19 TaxID=3071708 RepID=UPI002DFB3712|nr:hypothetical protein [Actimicrobium sp. GrIS 1.19]
MHRVSILALGCIVVGLTACSSQQLYAIGQTAQRDDCYKINDNDERGRCLGKANASYDAYQRQSDQLKANK